MRHVQLVITTYNETDPEISQHDLWADEVDTALRSATKSNCLYMNIPIVFSGDLRRPTRVYRDLKSMQRI